MNRIQIMKQLQKTIKKAIHSKHLFVQGCSWYRYAELKAMLIMEQREQWRKI